METITLQYSGGLVVEPCEVAWASADQDVTVSRDTADKVVGEASAKIEVGADVEENRLVAYRFLPVDIDVSDGTALKLRWKVSVNVNGGDFQLLIGNRVGQSMPTYAIDLPAQTAAAGWVQVTVQPADWGDLNAVMYVGLVMVVDKGAITVRIDDIRVDLPSTVLDVLSVKGIDSPDVVAFPRAAKHEDLAGNSVVRIIGFKRMPVVTFSAILEKEDRVALFRWLYRSEIQQIVYEGETMDVVLAEAEGYELEWLDDISFATGFTLYLEEKVTRSSIPSSWTS